MSAQAQAWLERHPWLGGVAALQALVDEAAACATFAARVEHGDEWEAAAADLEAGVPLLRSRAAHLDVVRKGAAALRALAERVAAGAPSPEIAAEARALQDAFEADPAAAEEAIRWLLRGAPSFGEPLHAGLVRYLGWSGLRRVLAPVVAAFDPARDGRRWHRGSCPTCGAPPAMGALVPAADGRARHLACGCCGTRWAYQRVACPFCGNEDADRLSLLELEEEPPLRLDLCEECKGYVKTWTGAGEGAGFFLSDWPTLHLDVLARDHGYQRIGASLYEIGE